MVAAEEGAGALLAAARRPRPGAAIRRPCGGWAGRRSCRGSARPASSSRLRRRAPPLDGSRPVPWASSGAHPDPGGTAGPGRTRPASRLAAWPCETSARLRGGSCARPRPSRGRRRDRSEQPCRPARPPRGSAGRRAGSPASRRFHRGRRRPGTTSRRGRRAPRRGDTSAPPRPRPCGRRNRSHGRSPATTKRRHRLFRPPCATTALPVACFGLPFHRSRDRREKRPPPHPRSRLSCGARRGRHGHPPVSSSARAYPAA